MKYSISQIHTIQWALNTLNIFRTNMRISLSCSCTRMTKELLNIAQVCSVFQQMSSERVPQYMNTNLSHNACALSSFFKNLLHTPLRKMPIRRLPWKEPTSWSIFSDVFCTISHARLDRIVLRSFCPFPCLTMSVCLSISRSLHRKRTTSLTRSPEE